MESTKQKIQLTAAERFIDEVVSAMDPGETCEVNGITIAYFQGKQPNILVRTPHEEIDFSKGPNGEPELGTSTPIEEPHELSESTEPVFRHDRQTAYPQSEGDMQFMSGLAQAIRDNRSANAA